MITLYKTITYLLYQLLRYRALLNIIEGLSLEGTKRGQVLLKDLLNIQPVPNSPKNDVNIMGHLRGR